MEEAPIHLAVAVLAGGRETIGIIEMDSNRKPRKLREMIRFHSAMPALTMAFWGGVYLYIINTLPEVSDPYFTAISARSFLAVQLFALMSYMAISLAAAASAQTLDFLFGKMRPIPLPWRILSAGATTSTAMAVTLVCLIMPTFRRFTGIEWGGPWIMLFIASTSATVAYACIVMHRSERERYENSLQLQTEANELNAALDLAELSMLEAQIEPHFLFNTLAHIKRQYRNGSGQGNQMLLSLIAYLDHAMPALRRSDWTIGDELCLVKTYLDILAQRFGSRLRFEITVSDACKKIYLPALVVTTLVENSVRHGLAPKAEGGTVSIAVDADDDILRIEVRDDGVGFSKTSGSGLGLATIQARLHGAYGSRAELTVGPLHPQGVRAAILIPLFRRL